MGFFDSTGEARAKGSVQRADELRKRAKEAADRNDDERASELYFEAAACYTDSGDVYWEKYCESWGWSQRAKSVKCDSAEDFLECAELYDNSIRADNGALQHIAKDDKSYSVTEGNMRFTEGDKYTAMANAEVERANATSGSKKAEHLRRAAEYRLSGAQTMKLAAELSRGEGRMESYYNRLGIYHRDRSGYRYYRASAERELDMPAAALEEYEKALGERNTAIDMLKRSLKVRSDRGVKDNLKQDRAMLKTLKKEIGRIAKDAGLERQRMKAAAEAGRPNLDVEVNAREGMVQNLVSTISVVLTNTGDGTAKNVRIELQSPFLDGEKRAVIGSIPPSGSTNVGLSVVPLRAGRPKARLATVYEDGIGRTYRIREMSGLVVAGPEDNRPPPTTIYNVKGDYLGDGASKVDIRDSVIQRSNIGKDISVKTGIDDGEFRDAVEKLDERADSRTGKILDGQRALGTEMKAIRNEIKRGLNKMLREMPYPADMRKERGSVVMEYRCECCDAEIGSIRDRRWERWVHMALGGALMGAGVLSLRPEMGMKGVKKLYEGIAGKPLSDLPRERMFLTDDEREGMVRKLRKKGILDGLNHCPECGKWVCEECFDADEGVCNEELW